MSNQEDLSGPGKWIAVSLGACVIGGVVWYQLHKPLSGGTGAPEVPAAAVFSAPTATPKPAVNENVSPASDFDATKAPTWTADQRADYMRKACLPNGLCYPGQIYTILETAKTPAERTRLTAICLDMKKGFAAKAKALWTKLDDLEKRARETHSGSIGETKAQWVDVDAVRTELNALDHDVPGVATMRGAAGDIRLCFSWEEKYKSACPDARKGLTEARTEMAKSQREDCVLAP